ncbi:hypothetical protein MHBO_000984 [Bonamia ostreae]|uniref:NAC-A/B domain-containing protein n=1 Tax=Bonamia ostreae TaxID=126728 RepID=A0ABV2AI05_9EUKA
MAAEDAMSNMMNQFTVNPKMVAYQNKMARKFKKSLLKKNIRKLSDIKRVVIEKGHGILIVIDHPEVYHVNDTDSVVVFGDAVIDDVTMEAQKKAAKMLQEYAEKKSAEEKENSATNAEEEQVDETGLDAEDIEMVMDQGGVDRAGAVKALRENLNDVVQAIISLTE